MAAPKKSTGSKKIIDVNQPDSSPPTPSSKPVLVSNRPLMKDPMVTEGDEMEDGGQKILVKSGRELKLKPLSAPELPIEAAVKETEESVAKEAEKVEDAEEASPPPQTSDKPQKMDEPSTPEVAPEQSAVEAAVNPSPPEPTTPTPPEAEPEAPEVDPKDAKTVVAAQKPASEENVHKEEETETSPKEDAATEAKPPKSAVPDASKLEAEEAAKKAEHQAEVEKLVESKQYYLPINAVEKRKSRRFVTLGVLLSLVLIIAWGDIALDAGIINVSANLPHTHFFSASPAASQTTPPAPVVATKQKPLTPAETQAETQLESIQKLLKSYDSANGAYPTNLSPAPLLSSAPAGSSYTSATFTPPSGVRFVYTPLPSGCSASSKNCLLYILKAEGPDGLVIETLHA